MRGARILGPFCYSRQPLRFVRSRIRSLTFTCTLFERIKESLCRATSAAKLATAAQNFGQKDDITVLSLVRVGVKEQPSTFKTDTLSTASP